MTRPSTASHTAAPEALQRLVDDMVSPAPGAPAGGVLGIDIAGHRTVVTAGVASPESGAPMHRTTVFDLASVSKVVGTTTCLHRLSSMGELAVDTPVRHFVPSYGGADETTVRDLLLHRAGLWEWQPLYLAPGGQEDPHRVIDELPLRYAPGHERHYSDLGFITLARVIESVTGSPLGVAVHELVADALQLHPFLYGPVSGDVATSGNNDDVERRMVATGDPYPVLWHDDGFTWRPEPIRGTVNDGNCAYAFHGAAGHAGLFASIDSLLDVGTALSSANDSPSLWDADVTADFFTAGPDAEQALGWRRSAIVIGQEALPLLWHPGFTGTAVGFVPGRHIAVALATNRLLADKPQPTTMLWQRAVAALTEILGTQE